MAIFEKILDLNTFTASQACTYEGNDEAALILRCQKGDHSAFNLLFKKYRNQAFEVAYRFTRNGEDSEDVVQSAFIRAFKYIQRFDTRYPFYPWLRMIVINESQTFLEKKKRKKVEPLENPDPEVPGPIDVTPDTSVVLPDERVRRKQLRELINTAVDQLPEQQRICFTLFEMQDMKVREIAEQLNCTEGTVKTHLHRARYTLRVLLKDSLKDY
jgi:RNA polymerase sigma-70 factor (ECF subfamily)